MKEKQLHGEELTKEDLKRAVKDEAYRKKLLEELNSHCLLYTSPSPRD